MFWFEIHLKYLGSVWIGWSDRGEILVGNTNETLWRKWMQSRRPVRILAPGKYLRKCMHWRTHHYEDVHTAFFDQNILLEIFWIFVWWSILKINTLHFRSEHIVGNTLNIWRTAHYEDVQKMLVFPFLTLLVHSISVTSRNIYPSSGVIFLIYESIICGILPF